MSITKSSQLSVFSIIKSIMLSNSILSGRFTGRIFQFEQKPKSGSFRGFPYIYVEIPISDTVPEFLGDVTDEKTFEIYIYMLIEYLARDKVLTYSNAILDVLNSSNAKSTFIAAGYYLEKTELVTQPQLTLIDQKDVLVTNFVTYLGGEVR